MVEAASAGVGELLRSLNATVEYLKSVRAVEWAEQLARICEHIENEPRSGIGELLAVLPRFAGLYLSGARYGHNVSERQEIEANGKLHILRDHLREIATESQSAAK